MCGIIGYIGSGPAAKIVRKSLKNLEYRGYDSCGIALVDDGKIQVKKDAGKVDEVLKEGDTFLNNGTNIAIGHTRWATHGGVTQENAHPHVSNNGEIAVVHNGIIENYQELRRFLVDQGFEFKSQTDTEIIPNLIEFYSRDMGFLDAVKTAMSKLEGSYAVVATNSRKGFMIGTRREAPLVLGIGKDGHFMGSDVPAFLEHTKKIIYLKDGDVIFADGSGIKVIDFEGNEIERAVDTIEWSVEQAQKGDFDHFMLKEISEQADVIKRAIKQDDKIINEIADEIKKAGHVYFVACGTAGYACLSASYIFSKIAKIRANVYSGTEFADYCDFLDEDSLVVAVSQSGETADTLSAIREAKKRGAKVISIVNVMGSSLVRESHKTLMQHAGPEICVLSTKSYTSQLAILTLLAYAVAGRLDEGKAKLKDLINNIFYLTSKSARTYVKKLADKLKDADHLFTIGRSFQYPTALEAALKIKEVSYIHAEGFAGGDLKHGPIALIEEGTPCIVFTSRETEKLVISNAMEIKSRGGYIIGVGPKNNEVFDFFIKVREAEEANSICQIIPIQILSYQLALLRGCDPDKPRNLAKSVVVK